MKIQKFKTEKANNILNVVARVMLFFVFAIKFEYYLMVNFRRISIINKYDV